MGVLCIIGSQCVIARVLSLPLTWILSVLSLRMRFIWCITAKTNLRRESCYIVFFTSERKFIWCFVSVSSSKSTIQLFNPFSTNVPLLYPLKTTENLLFSHVFRGYRSGTLIENGLRYVLASWLFSTDFVTLTFTFCFDFVIFLSTLANTFSS